MPTLGAYCLLAPQKEENGWKSFLAEAA